MSRYILIAIALILLILGAINALLNDYFSNTFLIGQLTGILALSGLLTGLVFALLIVRNTGISEAISRVQIFLLATILSALLFVVCGVNANYLFAKKSPEMPQCTVLDIRPYFKTGGGIIKGENVVPNGYLVLIEKDGGPAEIRYKTMNNFKSLIGQTVVFDIRRGLLGYEVFLPSPIEAN